MYPGFPICMVGIVTGWQDGDIAYIFPFLVPFHWIFLENRMSDSKASLVPKGLVRTLAWYLLWLMLW